MTYYATHRISDYRVASPLEGDCACKHGMGAWSDKITPSLLAVAGLGVVALFYLTRK